MSWNVVDISYYQTISNYQTLADACNGVIIRCGYRGYGSSGTLVQDPMLQTHYNGLVGTTKIGYYWFSQAISDSEAIEEADYVIDTLLTGKQNDMPIYFDSEIADTSEHSGRADNLTKSQRTQYCLKWIERIQERGYRAGVYASENWFVNNLDYEQIRLSGASIWVAKWGSTAPSTSVYDGWQYTSSGHINGLSNNFDMSNFYNDIAGWTEPSIPVQSINITDSSISINKNNNRQLSVEITPSDATNKEIIWETDDSIIATIDSAGILSGLEQGTVTVTAKSAEDPSITDTCDVTVLDPLPEDINISNSEITVAVDKSADLFAQVEPYDAVDQNVIWEVADNTKVRIESGGDHNEYIFVYGLAIGTTTITARSHYDPDNIYAVCNVEVIENQDITGVTLNKYNLAIEKGTSETLIAKPIPASAPAVITWASSDENIATVDENGNVTAIEVGECEVIASIEEYSATCEVRVKISPTSMTLNYSEIDHIFNETRTEDLKPSFTPDDCTETDVEWTSTDENIVVYSKSVDGLIYYGGNGRCTITATDVVGHTASCNFNVYTRSPKPEPPVAESIEERSVTLESLPYTKYSIDSGRTWQDSNVFDNLEPNKKYYFVQKTIDHGYYKESQKSDYTEIKTKDIIHVESVELNEHDLIINLDNGSGEFQFENTVLPEDAEIKNVYYSLDNTSIGFVDSDGTFKAVNYGEGTVTVTSIDGRKSDTCNIKVYKKWDTPAAPIVTEITPTSMTLITDNLTVFSLDGGNVWQRGPLITGLSPKTSYNVVCKRLADGLRNESDISPKTFLITPEDIYPYDPDPIGVTLSAHNLEFDLNGNTYTTLLYTVVPLDTKRNDVIWYTSDSSIINIGSGGEVNAVGLGKAKITIRTIAGGKTDTCQCVVYKINPRPEPPTLKEVTNHTIEIYPLDNCEYSIDGEHWTSSTFFGGLNKNTYYTLYQRYKANGEYEPASEASYGLTVKTLTDETPGGESESGYTWGQEVECNNIPVYGSPFTDKSNFKISGKYYIFNLIERKHRIRLVKIYDYVGVYGHAVGWVNIADLKLIENTIYEGDKVIVDGDINIYADGSGTFIHEDKQTMYVTEILEDQEYCYGVTSKPGLKRQGFAKEDQVTKYKSIIIN